MTGSLVTRNRQLESLSLRIFLSQVRPVIRCVCLTDKQENEECLSIND